MNHIQITITASEVLQEQLVAQLSAMEAVGFEQTEKALLVYFEEENFNSYDVNEVLKDHAFQISTVAEKNWNEAWEKDFQPVIIEGFCAIRAHFHPPVPNVTHELIITPKMSFGTGHHATTCMMVQQMREIPFKDKTVFDFGTGTGILAILAEKLGAARITAIDNDPWSINNAKENIEKNSCSRIELILSDVVPEKKIFDILLANINKNVILENLVALKAACAENGRILLSGLILEDEKELVVAAQQQGLQVVHQMKNGGWISLLLTNSVGSK